MQHKVLTFELPHRRFWFSHAGYVQTVGQISNKNQLYTGGHWSSVSCILPVYISVQLSAAEVCAGIQECSAFPLSLLFPVCSVLHCYSKMNSEGIDIDEVAGARSTSLCVAARRQSPRSDGKSKETKPPYSPIARGNCHSLQIWGWKMLY